MLNHIHGLCLENVKGKTECLSLKPEQITLNYQEGKTINTGMPSLLRKIKNINNIIKLNKSKCQKKKRFERLTI